MKKLTLLITLWLHVLIIDAQLENFYSFHEPYFMSPAFATLKIKSCKVYQEIVSDSIHEPYIVEHYQFDTLGRLVNERRYYKPDTLWGIRIHHTYNIRNQITKSQWTWIEDAEDWYSNYTYDKNGKLTRLHEFNQREGRKHFRTCEVAKFRYGKEGLLSSVKLKNDFDKKEFIVMYKNDTTFLNDLASGDKWRYVGGRLVEKKNAAGTYTYEYNANGELVQYKLRSVWDKPIINEVFSYVNGLLITSRYTEYRYDETVIRERSYIYE